MSFALCPGCRSPLEEEGEFCPRCGVRTRRSAGSSFMIGALLALLVLGAGWGGYYLGSRESPGGGGQPVGLPPPVRAAAPEPSSGRASRDEEAIARVKAWELGGSSVEARLQTVEAWLRGSGLMGEMPGSWSAWQDSEFPEYYLVRLTWVTAFGPRELVWRVHMGEGQVTPANALASRLENFENLQGDPAAFLVGEGPGGTLAGPVSPSAQGGQPSPPQPLPPPPQEPGPGAEVPAGPGSGGPGPGQLPPPFPADVELVGIMEVDGARQALLRQGDRHYTLRIGERIGAWKVQAISPQEVVLVYGQKTFSLRLALAVARPSQRRPQGSTSPAQSPTAGSPQGPPEEPGARPGRPSPGAPPPGEGPGPLPRGEPQGQGGPEGYPQLPESTGYPGQQGPPP